MRIGIAAVIAAGSRNCGKTSSVPLFSRMVNQSCHVVCAGFSQMARLSRAALLLLNMSDLPQRRPGMSLPLPNISPA
jgi:hypothetical protein